MKRNKGLFPRLSAAVIRALLLFILVNAPAGAWGQERVEIRAWKHSDYGRIVFDWPSKIEYAVELKDKKLTITFDQAMIGNLRVLAQTLPSYVETARLTPGKQQAVITLTRDFNYQTFVHDRAVVIDLSEKRQLETAQLSEDAGEQIESGQPTLPLARPEKRRSTATKIAPQPVGKTAIPPKKHPRSRPALGKKNRPEINVRAGRHPGFSRVVFDWNRNVRYEVEQATGKARIRFQSPATLRLAKINRQPPPHLSKIESRTHGNNTDVILDIPENARLRHFRSSGKIVVDILGTAPTSPETPPLKITDDKSRRQPTDTAPPLPITEVNQRGRLQEEKDSIDTRPQITVTGIPGEDALVLHFETPQNTLAVAYRRAGSIWIGFDRSFNPKLAPLADINSPFFKGIAMAPNPGLTLLRLDVPNGVSPQLMRDGPKWLIELAKRPFSPMEAIIPKSQPNDKNREATVSLPETGSKQIIRTTDPIIGDELILVPLSASGRGIEGDRDYIQFTLPSTTQGIVIVPKADELRVTIDQDGVLIGSPEGLYISTRSDDSKITGSATNLLNITDWVKGPAASFHESKYILQNDIIQSSETDRNQARLRLAQYYFANRLHREAKGLLKYMSEIDPSLLNDPYHLLLAGVAHYLDGDYSEADNYLSTNILSNQPEAALWRAVLAAENGDWENAATAFSASAHLIDSYPVHLIETLSLTSANAALNAGLPNMAKSHLERISQNLESLRQPDYARYLIGKVMLEEGKGIESRDIWEQVAKSRDRKSSALARRALIDYDLSEGDILLAEATDAYEGLSFAWRGDEFELTRLERLAELYKQAGDPRASLLTLKQAAVSFPENQRIQDITARMSDAFSEIFLGENPEKIDPVATLGIFREFRELTPVGEEGDRLIESLVDRMISIDLLNSAAELLGGQVQFRSKGVKKARNGLKLAMVNMLNDKPEQALNALDISEVTNIPENLTTERRHIRARALYDAGQEGQAFDTLKGDSSIEAEQIRAQMHWESRQWEKAAEAIGRMTAKIQRQNLDAAERELFDGEPPPEGIQVSQMAVLTDDIEPQTVLRWAVALALSKNRAGLHFLRERYNDLMRPTPYYDDFILIINEPIGSAKTMQAIASQIGQVGQYEAFLASYRERLQPAAPTVN